MTRLLDALFRLRLWLGWYPAGRITWDETGTDWQVIDHAA
jgi:hypothetical protein